MKQRLSIDSTIWLRNGYRALFTLLPLCQSVPVFLAAAHSCRRCRRICVKQPHSKGGWVRASIHQDVLAGDVRGVHAAQESTGVAELRGSAETLGRNLRHGQRRERGFRLAALPGGGRKAAAQALGIKTSRQK